MKTTSQITAQIHPIGLTRTRYIFAAVIILIIAVGIVLTGYLERIERKNCELNCRNEAALLQSHLMANINPVDHAVLTMSGSPWLQRALTSKVLDLDSANDVLDRYQKSMDVSVCYLMNAAGMTVASSNRHAADSFMGKSFEFRPYFTEAIAGRPGRYFAKGSVSNIRGYYASAPVRNDAGSIIGVAVIKKDLDEFENILSQWPHSYVVSPEGIIFLSSEPQMLFRSLWPATTGKLNELVKSRQFGALNFEPVLKQEPVDATYLKYEGELHDVARLPLPITGWSIVYLNTSDELVNYRLFGILLTLVACVLALFGYFALARVEEKHKIAAERIRVDELLTERRKLRELEIDVGLQWLEGEEIQGVLQVCAETIVAHLDAAFARIWLLNQEENVLELKASAGMYTHLDGAHGRVPVGKFKIGLIAEERKPHLTNAVIGDPRVSDQEWAKREGMVSFAGYPLLVEGRLMGVMAMFARHQISEFALDILGLVADKIAMGISRKQMIEALRESETEFRNLLEEAPLAITVVNTADEIEYINRKNIEIIGYSRNETPTLAQWWSLAYPDPEERSKITALWGNVRSRVMSGENIGKKERRITCKDGTKRDVEMRYSRAGEKIIVIFNDVTERKRMEAELLTVQKLEAVGLLAGGIAHDFNNSLNVICGNLSLAMMIGVPDKAADLLREAESACEKSKDLSARLITFSKGGTPLLERQPVGEMVREALQLLSKPDNISIELGQMIDGTVEADRRQIIQVLRSLLINAVEAMPQGGVVRIEARDMKLKENDIPSLPAGEYVRISVTDNGAGILPEHLPKIFDPYFSTKERFSDRGMGLGLAVCWSIVRKHEGAITLESIVGTGSVFHVYLRST